VAFRQIQDGLRSDHLILLVGTNPLPNWVAAKLLLKSGGRVHLFRTDGVRAQSSRLERVLKDRENISVSVYQTVEADEQTIYNDIERQAEILLKTSTGKIGLDYTGGTKMMSVHAHRAMREVIPRDRRVLSYLDAHSLAFKFDGYAKIEPPINLHPDVRISIETLLFLHDDYRKISYEVNHKCVSAAEGLVEIHSNYRGKEAWRGWCDSLKLNNKKIGKINVSTLSDDARRTIVSRLNNLSFPKTDDFALKVENKLNGDVSNHNISSREARSYLARINAGYSTLLDRLQGNKDDEQRPLGGDFLQEIVQKNDKQFKDSLDLARWLDSGWLEHYALAQIQSCAAADINPDGCAINLVTETRSIKSRIDEDQKGREFEADVIALRGYQLFYFSCYTGHEPSTAKQKLFEAMHRATQLGGDEAKVALICTADDPQAICAECEADWQMENINRIRVFGRAQLSCLAESLESWFEGRK
jgi:hypothetical protein